MPLTKYWTIIYNEYNDAKLNPINPIQVMTRMGIDENEKIPSRAIFNNFFSVYPDSPSILADRS
jgi:hypothetical protein